MRSNIKRTEHLPAGKVYDLHIGRKPAISMLVDETWINLKEKKVSQRCFLPLLIVLIMLIWVNWVTFSDLILIVNIML